MLSKMTEQCSRSVTSGLGTAIVALSRDRESKVLTERKIGEKVVENDDDTGECRE